MRLGGRLQAGLSEVGSANRIVEYRLRSIIHRPRPLLVPWNWEVEVLLETTLETVEQQMASGWVILEVVPETSCYVAHTIGWTELQQNCSCSIVRWPCDSLWSGLFRSLWPSDRSTIRSSDLKCALRFVRKHSLGTSGGNGWPRTWFSTHRSTEDTGAISSETVRPYRSPSAANAAVLGMVLRSCSSGRFSDSDHTAAKTSAPRAERAIVSACSTTT
jgi:hypothetical protein